MRAFTLVLIVAALVSGCSAPTEPPAITTTTPPGDGLPAHDPGMQTGHMLLVYGEGEDSRVHVDVWAKNGASEIRTPNMCYRPWDFVLMRGTEVVNTAGTVVGCAGYGLDRIPAWFNVTQFYHWNTTEYVHPAKEWVRSPAADYVLIARFLYAEDAANPELRNETLRIPFRLQG